MAWDDVCNPKKEGGLGIKNIIVSNKACMVRHLWDLARKEKDFGFGKTRGWIIVL